MVYANQFKYGEISPRNAGRFDSEFYRQGCFRFRNMVTDFTGSATRRPPIRKHVDTDAELIIEFSVSETLVYTIGIGKEKLRLYRFVLDEYREVANVAYPDSRILTLKEIKELRWAQYYTRMYFVHEDFRPFFVDLNTSSDSLSVSNMTVILNQDAKAKYWFTPAYVEDENGDEVPALEGRVLYRKEEDGIVSWYLDADLKEPYEYSVSYPPIHGESSYISNYDEFPDDDLLTGEGNYPSGISIINDSIYLFATRNHPQVFWKSRFLGSSQWIEGYGPDTMHDFVRFQAVYTEGKELVDSDDLPMTDLIGPDGTPYYEQENGNTKWFVPDKDEDGNYLYQTRVYRYYRDEDINTDNYIWVYDLSNPENTEYDIKNGTPVGKPIEIYDLSNADRLMKTSVSIDFTTTDSCACREEVNSGRMDRIRDIISGCGYIFVLTSSREYRLPGSFSAVNYHSADPYTTYGSMSIRAVNLNSSVMFLQKSGVLREFYLYQGYMAHGDITSMNHDILSDGVFQIAVKNTPDPRLFFVMEDGTCVTLTYDKENSIQSFSTWDMEGRKIASAAGMAGALKDTMLFLVKGTDESWIGYLDESESSDFSDEGKTDYVSDIATPYTEIIDNSLAFGRYKKAQTVWIRPYDTGRIEIGNDGDELRTTEYDLGNSDYKAAITGTSRRQFSFRMRSHGSSPMTILAYAYEVM